MILIEQCVFYEKKTFKELYTVNKMKIQSKNVCSFSKGQFPFMFKLHIKRIKFVILNKINYWNKNMNKKIT